MIETLNCPKCSAELSANSPTGLCPKCLLQAGLEGPSQVDATVDSPRSGERFTAPVPAELAGKFPQLEILELLGQGGMGAVYKARQLGLERMVALKILPPEVGRDPAFAERFGREARALGRLNHPNVVTVYEFGQSQGLYYLLMEFVDGVNLRQAIKAGSITPQDALAVIPQVCDALQYAHDEGVVHRDIKPENILLDRRGRVKIADFGLAKLLSDQVDVALTQTHQVMGTLRYMAPEQMEGTHTVDHRADIYSLGVVFYELLTGELPMGRFAPPSKKVQIDVRLDEVVLRALEREPQLRYQHVSEVKTEMEAIYDKLPSALKSALGREYKSKANLFGVPLVHIAYGIDSRTGKKRVAKGIIAMGDIAMGVFAFGGLAMGGLAVGGVSIGFVSLGGVALGIILAIGGCAIGSFAFGGLAIGGVAVGGMAVGYYAFGGGVAGVHTMSGAGVDPAAKELFSPWAFQWTKWITLMSMLFPVGCAVMYGLIWLVFRKQAINEEADRERRSGTNLRSGLPRSSSPEVVASVVSAPVGALPPAPRPWLVPVLAALNLLSGVLIMLIASAEDGMPFPDTVPYFWHVWSWVESWFSFGIAGATFAASIGLFLWQPWARKLTVIVSIVSLASLVIDMPFLTRALIPHVAADIQLTAAAEGASAEEQEIVAFVVLVGIIGPILLTALAWNIGLLIYLTRPRIIAAFERSHRLT